MKTKLWRYILIYTLFCILPLCIYGQQSISNGGITFEVTDSLQNPLAYATVVLKPASGEGRIHATTTDTAGECRFTLPEGLYDANISYVGYVPQKIGVEVVGNAVRRVIRLRTSSLEIQSVVVTASESKGVTSSSKIDRKAMEHLQPSSFSDLLALLPGGRATSPSLSNPNTIHLREIAVSDDDYNTSALGTAFIVDGAPIRNDANMQFVPYGASYDQIIGYRTFQNKGVDMRSISTDEIEHVEIIRGIPSVEYGDLTSGLVKIERKRGGNALNARVKMDMDSKLFYIGKGFELPERDLTVNLGVDLLDAKFDPRNKLENYKRLTGSLRVHKTWDKAAGHTLSLGTNFDYTGSFDNKKIDPESNNGNLDDYKSKYNRMALSVDFDYRSKTDGFFRALEITASADYSRDRIERRRFVQITKPTAAPNSLTQGEHDAVFLDPTYIGEMTVDGQPLTAYAKAVATFGLKSAATNSTISAGADWALDKNLGKGQVYDMTKPLFSDVSTRPRAYSDIPAQHDLGLFVEDNTTVTLGRSRLEVMAGVRASTMLNLPKAYALHGKFYFDPRVNARFAFPSVKIGSRRLETAVSGGFGWHTKTPTMSQLNPNPLYFDFQQLNYFHNNPAFRRINMMTYVVDPTNYELGAARNFKWEARGDVSFGGNRLSVTYFQEDMKSGFRSSSRYTSYTFKKYATDGIDGSQLEGPPSLEGLPYTTGTRIGGMSVVTNSSRTLKKGVEFTFSSRRIESLRTRLTMTGAWFRTEYSNSDPIYIYPGKTIGYEQVLYTGIYTNDSHYIREMCNTNFMVDTDIPRLGLGFSIAFQCQWTNKDLNTPKSSRPSHYYGPDNIIHPFTDESAEDPQLKTLIVNYNDDAFKWHTIPFAMTTNLKITKKLFKDKLTAAMFITQMLNYTPSYKVDGITVRRSTTPYFGMELNFNL